MDITTLFDAAEQTLINAQKRQEAIVDYLNQHQEIINELLPLITESNIETEVLTFLVVPGTSELYIGLSGTKENLNKIFSIFRKCGLYPRSRPKENDTSYYTYFYAEDSDFRVWFSFTSTVCRRVAVGTRIVEETIYEVQCE